MLRICVICSAMFEVRNPKRPAKTCSRACRNKMVWRDHRATGAIRAAGPPPEPREIAACAWCGQPVKWAQRPSRQGKYCSRLCAGRAKTKGGLKLKDGRWRVRLRDGGWQLYSRCVMEAHIGRHLTYDEVVHHRNSDPTDDRRDNLEVLRRAEHSRMHTTEYWRILRAQGR